MLDACVNVYVGIGLVVDLIQYTVYYFVLLIPYPIVLAINIFFLITKILDIHIYNLSEKREFLRCYDVLFKKKCYCFME